MSDTVIRVEHLSKSYQYGTISHGTLHKDLQSWWARLRGKEDPNTIISHTHRPGQSGERFWALQDISFDVHQGEIVGIIGRNGAGKSTLLKILSEITTPTRGCAKLKGRVGSLLEVGTGFHPELTGRENVYLNGAILGMRKAEIVKKFDEIVAFAEIEEFIDTPVKRYSSGMYVRLAFAVAAHLESEILLVDEVLAVGDMAFQKKCLGKMEDVTEKEGRTVLFVSHNLLTIRELCSRAILLTEGEIAVDGVTNQAIEAYIQLGASLSGEVFIEPEMHNAYRGLDKFKFTYSALQDQNGQICSQIPFGSPFVLVIQGEVAVDFDNLLIGFSIFRAEGQKLFMTVQKDAGLPTKIPAGTLRLRCRVEPNLLLPGRYWVNIGSQGPNVSMHVPQVLNFDISPVSSDESDQVESYREGFIRHPVIWEYEGERSIPFSVCHTTTTKA